MLDTTNFIGYKSSLVDIVTRVTDGTSFMKSLLTTKTVVKTTVNNIKSQPWIK